MSLRPLEDKILVKRDKVQEEKSTSGLIIASNKETSNEGIVIAVGPGITLQDGSTHAADIVIANADANLVYSSLLPTSKTIRRERRKLKKATPSFSGFSLQIGLDNSKGAGPQMAHHNIYFPSNYDEEFEDLFTHHRPVQDPTIYICAPAGMSKNPENEAWSVLINAPLHNPEKGWDWNTNKDEYASKIISLMDKRGLNVSPRIAFLRVQTPADLENETLAPGGSIYGTSSNGARAAFLRAKNKSPLKNLYLVGGSAHPGGGLPLVGMSAEIVAESVQRELTGTTSEGVRNHHAQH